MSLIILPIAVKYEEVANPNMMCDLSYYIDTAQAQPELQDLAIQIITNLCKDQKILKFFSTNVDINKLEIKPESFNIHPDAQTINYFHPLPYYEGAPKAGGRAQTDPNTDYQPYLKKPPKSMATTISATGLKETNAKGMKTPEVRSRPDQVGRRLTSKEKGVSMVNKTFDSGSGPSGGANTNVNVRDSNKKISTRDESFDAIRDKVDKNRSKKQTTANFQLPTLTNSTGRPIFKNSQ